MKQQKQNVHYVLILDRSGSMESVKETTISGFNEQVQTTRELEQEHPEQQFTVTLVMFNDKLKLHYILASTKSMKELNEEDYQPYGNTALLDAIGHTAKKIEGKIKKEDRCVVTIFTDGLENSSSEYTHEAIGRLIKRLEETGQWTFSYIGAGQGTVQQATSININLSNVLHYQANPSGTKEAFNKLSKARRSYSDKIKLQEPTTKDFFSEEDS